MNDNTDKTAEIQSKLREAEMKLREQKGELRDAKSRGVRLAVGSAIGGFLLFAIGGQWFPGYQLDSTAEATSNQMATSAVSELMSQLCAERFMTTSGLDARLAALDEASGDWNKSNYIRDGAWANAPDGEKADYATAERCRNLIGKRVSEQSAKAS
ncbi:MAG: hypothetical protein OER43_08795 [Gammaproteobacteria bacterium]|nr:hypothetical protein [Gammaproteobacteria bacterium]